jgi:Flp pilus assembly protein TadG
LPLLAMLLVGIVYSGITFYDYVVLANSVAVGARTVAINRGAGTGPPTACAMGETALKNAAYSLKQASITIAAETFIGSSTCSALVAGDSMTMTATYPCYLTIPFTGATPINLCPVVSNGQGYIRSQTTVRVE